MNLEIFLNVLASIYCIGTVVVIVTMLFYMFMVIPPRYKYIPIMSFLSLFWPIWIWIFLWAIVRISLVVAELSKKKT